MAHEWSRDEDEYTDEELVECVCGHAPDFHGAVGCFHSLNTPEVMFCPCEVYAPTAYEILLIPETELPCCKRQDPIECGSLDAWLQLRESMHERESWRVTMFREVLPCFQCGHVHQIGEFTHYRVHIFISFNFIASRWQASQLGMSALCNECHGNVGYLG